MKKIVIFTLLLLIFIPLFAEEYDYTLRIRAFKPGDSGVVMKINNALTLEDLAFTSPSPINLNEHIERFVGNIPSTDPSSMVSNVVFSYRIEGADAPESGSVSYTLNISMTPFSREGGTEVIPALFQLGNLDVTFPGSAGEINSPTKDDWNISYADISVKNEKADSDSGNAVFSETWTVKNTLTSNANQMPNWIARGAVGLILDYSVFQSDKIPFGKYKSTVTLELVTP